MRKTFLGISVAALALAGATTVLAQHGERHNPDADGDGTVTLAEMQAHGADMFAKMDTNGDGVLNDADRSAHGAGMFAKADANGDGELTPDELKAAHEARMERREARHADRAENREARMAEHFAMADTDKSGGLSEDELRAMHAARGEHRDGKRHRGTGHGGHGGSSMMLHMADTDGDKAVTRAEFDGAIATHFAKMDTDGNGSVSQAERQAAHKAMRERMREHHGAHSEN
ncbi:EF-hand domain-containing protein [Erythrobacter mangrovi]|uniref:EF-hand domain-containing protein n=1 Tax=Erythrobacter mangrovi TaxID=2739433 RepID=A0A7D4CCF9_9SPHN|nr:EF-hand domain-containing protein [Erythrobacter mangrovi]QKG70729.1 EF-hand domain-containing protein [Erythrobacter mangrovi]